MPEEKRCQYERLGRKTCPHPPSRPWNDPETGELKVFCIFHAPMEAKKDKLDEFWNAFDALLEKTGKEYDAAYEAAYEEDKKEIELNCEGFVFPDTGEHFRWREFPFDVEFQDAQFTGTAYFSDAQFTGRASFYNAKFGGDAYFRGAQFAGEASFYSANIGGTATFDKAQFTGNAYFSGAQFTGDARFSGAQFTDLVYFSDAKFAGRAYFTNARFSGFAYFSGVRFTGDAYFLNAQFAGVAYFDHARFTGDADFSGAQFAGVAYFDHARFTGDADFSGAQFTGDASFEGANFGAVATFERARFLSYTDFRRITVEKDGEDAGTLLFRYVFFSDPSRVYVGGPGIKRCSTVGTNIEGVQFVDPEWSRRKGPFKKYRKKTFDEELAEKGAVNGDDEVKVTWEDAVEVYRKLRRNFEGRLAYETAGDFHYGQMECRRKNKDKKGFLAWCDRRLIGAYKFFFSYGESLLKPFLWFCLLVGVLALTLGPELATRSLFSFGVPTDVCLPQLIISQVGRLFVVIFATFFVLALRRRFKR